MIQKRRERSLEESLYATEGQVFEEAMKTKVRIGMAEKIRKSFRQEQVDRRTWVRQLAEKVRGLKPLRLVVATELTQVGLERLGAKVKQEGGEGVVIDLKYDGGLIGGGKVDFEGRYGDYGLKRKLEEMMGEEKESSSSSAGRASNQVVKSSKR